jgi:hypothetical protein
MRMIKPGFYVADDGALHFDVRQMMEHLGVPVTPLNVEMFTSIATEEIRREFGGRGVIVKHVQEES